MLFLNLKALKDILKHLKFVNLWICEFVFLMSRTGYSFHLITFLPLGRIHFIMKTKYITIKRHLKTSAVYDAHIFKYSRQKKFLIFPCSVTFLLLNLKLFLVTTFKLMYVITAHAFNSYNIAIHSSKKDPELTWPSFGLQMVFSRLLQNLLLDTT